MISKYHNCMIILTITDPMHVVHKNVVFGSSMIGFPLVIADSKQEMPGIQPGPLGWHTRNLSTKLQEVRHGIHLKLEFIICLV